MIVSKTERTTMTRSYLNVSELRVSASERGMFSTVDGEALIDATWLFEML